MSSAAKAAVPQPELGERVAVLETQVEALDGQFEERRQLWHMANNQLQSMVAVQKVQGETLHSMKDLHVANGEKIDGAVADILVMKAAMEKLTTAFPAGDVDGHRRYHEVLIERANLRNELMKQALIKIAQWGGLGLVVWVAHSALDNLKQFIRG